MVDLPAHFHELRPHSGPVGPPFARPVWRGEAAATRAGLDDESGRPRPAASACGLASRMVDLPAHFHEPRPGSGPVGPPFARPVWRGEAAATRAGLGDESGRSRPAASACGLASRMVDLQAHFHEPRPGSGPVGPPFARPVWRGEAAATRAGLGCLEEPSYRITPTPPLPSVTISFRRRHPRGRTAIRRGPPRCRERAPLAVDAQPPWRSHRR